MKIACVMLLLLAFAAVPAPGKTVQLPGENITLDVPDNWIAGKQAPYIYSESAPDHTSAIAVGKLPNPEGHGITPSFIAGTKKGLVDSAAKAGVTTNITSENALTIDGAPAYLFTTESTVGSKKIESSNYVIATHDFYYLLVVQTSDPARMPALQATANSFHFTVAPTMPDNGLDDFDAGERVGRYIGYALPLLVLAVIVKIVVGKARRTNA